MDVTLLVDRLRAAYPDAACALTHRDPFQLLVATILSAQCTDARVNMVTPGLFARFPDAAAMSSASQEELESIVRSTGFYRNKAKSIRGASERLVAAYGGRVPDTMEELLTLPGVARKTANVVLGTAYGVAVGIVVDTHVERIAKRLGLSRAKSPDEVERDLMALVPRRDWIDLAHMLIFHGRGVCEARKPRCPACPVRDLCPSAAYFERGVAPPWEKKGTARAAGMKPPHAGSRKETPRPGRRAPAPRPANRGTATPRPANRGTATRSPDKRGPPTPRPAKSRSARARR